MKLRFLAAICLIALASRTGFADDGAKKSNGSVENSNDLAVSKKRLLWKEPLDLDSRDLYLGMGGAAQQPQPPFTFVKEDPSGSNPKFEIVDRDGVKWKAKLGRETQSEIAANRIVWAVGYYTDVEYLVPKMTIEKLPKLSRGQNLVREGVLTNVRLKRDRGGKAAGPWKWKDNPFRKTREGNALRALMAVINNWDLKDENNVKFVLGKGDNDGELVYMVSDLGASFGSSGLTLVPSRSRSNSDAYADSHFITKVRSNDVDFGTPASAPVLMFILPQFYKRLMLRPIGDHVPKEDARWLGEMLVRLSPAQIGDAFRAAEYSAAEIEEFRTVLQRRALELSKL